MKKQLLLALLLAMAAALSIWVRQASRGSMGEEASIEFQPTPAPTVIADPGPRRSLVLVDFFAGY
jgi:hypothetical protein